MINIKLGQNLQIFHYFTKRNKILYVRQELDRFSVKLQNQSLCIIILLLYIKHCILCSICCGFS